MIRKDACWAISNIMVGTQSQVQEVIDAGIVDKLVFVLDQDDAAVRWEVARAISNALVDKCDAYLPQVEQLVEKGCIEAMIQLLQTSKGDQLPAPALRTLTSVVQLGKQKQELENLEVNPYLENFQEQGFRERLQLIETSFDYELEKAVASL